MRLSVCVGDYATTPYCISVLDQQVYCMEELCYCLRENAFLLDLSLLRESLVDWIGDCCGVKELARELYPMVRKQGSLSSFVTLILEYVGLYENDVIREIEKVLKDGSGLSSIEKRKNQIDYLVRKKRYPVAVNRYDDLLTRWQEEQFEGAMMPSVKVKADILHNKGVALAGMMEYMGAAEAFKEAYAIVPEGEYYQAYLASMRQALSESEYLSFVADNPDCYEYSLQLERDVEYLTDSFREQEASVRLAELGDWRFGKEKQRYYEKPFGID
jgi:tetratricopeptide (TPR) repeat protein